MELIEYKCDKLKESYVGFTHSSGLRVYVFPKKMSSSYALIATKYGSLENSFKLSTDADFTTVPEGIAHFLEHKMFENEDGVDTFERFGKTGANANAFTSFDKTAYQFSSTDNFYQSLEILLDFVTHPYFTSDTVQKEQGIIAQEIRMYEDNPDTRLYYELLRAMYEKNEVHTEIAGTVESISEITAELLYKCYNTFYNLHNMILCVCGDVEAGRVVRVLDKVLCPAQEQEIVRRYPTDGAAVFKPRSEIRMQVARPQFAIGVKDSNIPKDPLEFAKRDYGMKILNELMFGTSTAFYNDMYECGILNSKFSCEYDSARTFAYNYYSGETDDPDAFFGQFKSYIAEMQRQPIDSDAFLRAKRTVYADFVRLFDSTEDIACELIFNALLDVNLFDNVRLIDEIDENYVEKLLRDCFKPEYYALSVVSPLAKEANRV